MGICIGYQGTLDDPSRLGEFIEFVRRRTASFGWPSEEIGDRVSGILVCAESDGRPDGQPRRLADVEIRGVRAQPPDADAVTFTFDDHGRLTTFQQFPHFLLGGPVNPELDYFAEFPLFVRTTGAVETHIRIVALLREARSRYMSDLAVEDDTGYWSSSSISTLQKEHIFGSLFQEGIEPPATRYPAGDQTVRRAVEPLPGLAQPRAKALAAVV